MQSRSRRLLFRLAALSMALVFAAGVFVWFLGMPLEARYLARRLPVLGETPVAVRDSAVTVSPGRKIAFCGCEFDIPWVDLDDSKTKSGPNSTIFYFDSGLVALLKCEPPREFVDGVLSSTKMSAENIRRAYGDSASKSDYALTRVMLGTTPDAITVRNSHRNGPLIMAMLVVKAIATPRADSGMFSMPRNSMASSTETRKRDRIGFWWIFLQKIGAWSFSFF